MRTEEFTVPAGWYPDPLGLPQLRWWDNQAWTEHVSEARQPLVVQEPVTEPRPPASDPGSFETRRERREREERERREHEVRRRLTLGPLELEAPPITEETARSEPDPAQTDSARPEQAEPHPEAESPHHEAGGLRTESAAPAVPHRVAPAVPDPAAASEHAAARASAPPAAAALAWAIALLPLAQLVASLLLIGAGTAGGSGWLAAAIWLLPAPVTLALAVADARLLHAAGLAESACWRWSLLGAPAYLLARAIRLRCGFAPVVAWTGLAAALVASVLLVPGIVVAALPHVFAAEAEAAVVGDASAIGARLAVDCPAPPTIVGQEFTCNAEDQQGEDLAIRVAFDRSNGWIAWHVADWGVFAVDR